MGGRVDLQGKREDPSRPKGKRESDRGDQVLSSVVKSVVEGTIQGAPSLPLRKMVKLNVNGSGAGKMDELILGQKCKI